MIILFVEFLIYDSKENRNMKTTAYWATLIHTISLRLWNRYIVDIKNNAWVTMNNNFLVMSEMIRQWFVRVTIIA